MIRPANTIERVLVYSKPVDFRKAVDGLSIIVEEAMGVSPFTGSLFGFTNRQQLNWLLDGYDTRRLHPHQKITPVSSL